MDEIAPPLGAVERTGTVVDRFVEQAGATPEALAIAGPAAAWTYRELDDASDRLARLLRRHGVRPEEPVAVFVDRSERSVAALLGVLKAGATYVPIDADYPVERIALLAAESRCRLTLRCAPGALPPEVGGTVIDFDPVAAAADGGPGGGLGPLPLPGQLAYLLFTSGSTGRPKGVLVEHGSLANVVEDHVRAFAATAGDRILLFSSPAFDAYFFQVFVGLSVGATLVPLPDEVLGDRLAFLDYLREQGVTILSVPPAYLNALGAVDLGPVRLINTGGDASIVADARFHARRLRYLSTYGPTEATICSAWHEVDPARPYADGIPLGRPILGAAIHILGPDLSPLPAGEVGEIGIAGPGLARAYLHHPDLTAERFVPHPEARGERLYRTGDLGRWREDGDLEFGGRRDRQVKVRGHRIELAEIERCLERHPAVARAVVLAQGDDARSRRLAAYVVTREAITPAALRADLRQQLPAAAVPALIVPVESFPLTTHGKVDVAALAKLEARPASPSFREPQTAMERAIAGVWEQTLGTGPVGLDDELLDLGGDSLMAARLTSELRRQLGLEIAAGELVAGLTVAHLAERCGETAPVLAPEQTAEGDLAASHAQLRLWFVHQVSDEPGAYNLSQIYELAGALDPGALVRALRDLVARHPALRTRFAVLAGRPVQRIDDGGRFAPLVVDLGPRHELARALAEDLALLPFDLESGPLVRAVLARTGEGAEPRFLLLLSVHHIVCDGGSFGILTRDLGLLYAAAARGGPRPPGEATNASLTYGARQQQRLAGAAGERHREYWRRKLAGAVPLDLPLDHPRPPEKRFTGATIQGELAGELAGELRRLGREHRATLFMVEVALVKALLARYTGQESVTVGAPMTDRDEMGLADEVGFFVNTVALHDRVDARRPFLDLLREVRSTCLEAYQHQVYPFDRIFEDLETPRDPSRSPIFDVMVAGQREADVQLALPGVEVTRRPQRATGSKFDLSFDFIEREAGLGLAVEFATSLFEPWRIGRLLGHLEELARDLLAAPERPLAELRLLTAAEAAELARWQGAPLPPAAGRTLADLFAAAASRDPRRLALAGGGLGLTYAEAARRAGALARALRRHAAFVEGMRVGILAERSPRFFLGVLAAHQAGAAYVPFDTGWPDRRIAEALDQAECGIVLADRSLLDLEALRGRAVLPLDGEGLAAVEPADGPLPGGPAGPESLAYCIFTSGSTGRPKAVGVTHGNAVQAAEMWRHDYRLDRPVVLQLASFAFDVSAGDLCRSLMVGGTLVVADEAERVDPAAIVDLVERHGVTCFETTPVVARLLIRHLEESGRRMPPLDLLVVGSDVWHPEELERLRGRLAAGTRLLNSYGTTETTVDSSFFEATAEAPAAVPMASRYVPIGRPMASVEMMVLDAEGMPLPAGVAGEIFIAGPGVSRGYLGDPGLTAGKFLPHPSRAGERMYRPGDLGLWSPAGQLEILGRADRQAKVRGYRIELGEIENVLLSHPAVEAAVAVVAGPPGQGEPAAYVVARAPVDEAELRRHAAELLPPYMVPAAWKLLDRLPVSGSGKVDRRALPPFEPVARSGTAVAPRNAIERRLLELWRQVLPATASLGVEDPFFAVGGDSIRAVQVALAAAAAGLPLRAIDLFRHPTIAELARRLGAGGGGGPEPVPVDLAAVPADVARRVAGSDGADDVYPALAMQETMLRASREHPAAEAVYHGQSTWRVHDEDLCPQDLRRALAAVIARHPALRTALVEDREDGRLYQVVRAPSSVAVTEHDLTGLTPARRADAVERYLEADARAGFAAGAPLCRFALLRHGAAEIELVFSAHHAVDDGWSTVTLEAELFRLYADLRRGLPLPAAMPEEGCKQLAALEQEITRSPAAGAFWRDELAGWPDPPLVPRPGAVAAPRFTHLSLPLGEASAAVLKRRASSAGVSVKAFSLAALLEALATVLGSDKAAAGVVSSCRSERLTDPLGAVGLFWNIVPLPLRGGAGHAPREVEERLRRAEPYVRYPLSRITAARGGALPFFACFNFLDFHGREPLPAPLRLLDARWRETFHFPLTVAVSVDSLAGRVTVHLQHDRRLVDDSEAAALGRELVERLR